MEDRQKTVRLHQAQANFRHSSALYRGFVGGRGAGKSFVGAYDLARRARRGRTYLVGSPTSILMQDTTLPAFKAIAQDLGMWKQSDVRMTPYPTVRLTTGAEIRFRTAEDPEKMRGPNLSGVWLDEASLMDQTAYTICIAALREQGEQGWLSATFTPKGLSHWTFEVFGKSPPAPNTEIFSSKTKDNPFLPKEFQQTLEGQYSGMLASQELEGLFISMEGAEWPAEYFADHIYFDDWPACPWAKKVLSLDPSKGKADKSGDFNAFVFLAVDREGLLWVDCDMSQTRPIEPAAAGGASVITDGLEYCRTFAPNGYVIETNGFQEMVARAQQRVATDKNLTLPLYAINNTIPKVSRIRTLGTYFAQRRIRVRNTKGGRLLVQQLREFPVGAHDDGPDALKTAEVLADYLINGAKEGAGLQVLRA